MARPKKNVVRIWVTVPDEVYSNLEFFLLDPISGRLRYGALSSVITCLIQQLIRQMSAEGEDPAKVLRQYGVDIGLGTEEEEVE